MAIPAESFVLTPGAGGTLQQQIRAMVAEGILSGRFRTGDRMPSSRGLAEHLGLSRITVTLAYAELVAQDYLTSRGRSGYFVSDSGAAPARIRRPRRRRRSRPWTTARWPAHRFSRAVSVSKPADWRSYPYPFIYGQADATLFDHQNWRLCAIRALGRRDFEALTDDWQERDDPLLIEYIRRNILPRRGHRRARGGGADHHGRAERAVAGSAGAAGAGTRGRCWKTPVYPGLRAILQQIARRVQAGRRRRARACRRSSCRRASTWSSPPPAITARPMRPCRWPRRLALLEAASRPRLSWWWRTTTNSR